jgi:GTP-binding protein
MKFVDSIQISVRSGHGGPGLVSFRAAKNMPRLGADGGDGGFGGNVFLVGDLGLNTLSGLYYKKLYSAEDGEKGGPNGRTGANGKDMLIHVPLGTVAVNLENSRTICEVLKAGEKYLVAAGGKRGLGNLRFLSSTHQIPEESTAGGPSIQLDLQLELKLIADVGLAGFPNAGKSTLLSRISKAKPKIADYPFTTLIPHLGVVSVERQDTANEWGQSFVVADIPGLVEGASEGRGLGHDFLKHLERTKVIAYIIDGFSDYAADPTEALLQLQKELGCYSKKLIQKRSCVIVTKNDLDIEVDGVSVEDRISGLRQICPDLMVVSAVTGKGIREMIRRLYDLIQEEKSKISVEEVEEVDLAFGNAEEDYEYILHKSDKDKLDV